MTRVEAWAGCRSRSDAEAEVSALFLGLAPLSGRATRADGRPMRPVGGLADWLCLSDVVEVWGAEHAAGRSLGGLLLE